MTEILISSQVYNDVQFRQMCGEPLKDLQCSGQHGVMWAYKPYTIGPLTPAEAGLIPPLLCGSPRNIHKLSVTLGQDNVVGVSNAMVALRDTSAVPWPAPQPPFMAPAATPSRALYSTTRMPC